jgi:nucleoside-diphosphate-sugar epimerase
VPFANLELLDTQGRGKKCPRRYNAIRTYFYLYIASSLSQSEGKVDPKLFPANEPFMIIMETNTQVTHSEGIYHGLPNFDSLNNTAIITGSNGISGQAMLKILLGHPTRWTSIYALSQGPPLKGGITGPQVHHITVNFLDSSDHIAAVLKENGVTSGYCFFLSYKESPDPAVMERENGDMLRNFITAAHTANIRFHRLVLQTGGKHYGVHQGPYNIPAREDDPRVSLGPNFYYRQEDILDKFGALHNFTYSIIRPMTIIGALKGNYLNLAIALGLYLAVTKELGDAPIFNGGQTKYHSVEALSSSAMNAYFAEWCALTPSCANEAFNTSNGDVSVWARLFPDLCADIGLERPTEEQFDAPAPRPLKGEFPTVRPMDYREKGTLELRNSLQQWASEQRTIDAWHRLAAREGLEVDAFERASWGYADRNMAIGYSKLESMSKVRKFGFLGYVDSTESFLEVLEEARGMNILPRRVV